MANAFLGASLRAIPGEEAARGEEELHIPVTAVPLSMLPVMEEDIIMEEGTVVTGVVVVVVVMVVVVAAGAVREAVEHMKERESS